LSRSSTPSCLVEMEPSSRPRPSCLLPSL
jgi:hypothetical protein